MPSEDAQPLIEQIITWSKNNPNKTYPDPARLALLESLFATDDLSLTQLDQLYPAIYLWEETEVTSSRRLTIISRLLARRDKLKSTLRG